MQNCKHGARGVKLQSQKTYQPDEKGTDIKDKDNTESIVFIKWKTKSGKGKFMSKDLPNGKLPIFSLIR